VEIAILKFYVSDLSPDIGIIARRSPPIPIPFPCHPLTRISAPMLFYISFLFLSSSYSIAILYFDHFKY
jgi:hypothetical protein